MHSSNWVGRSGLHRESRATQADSLTVLKASKSEGGYAGTGWIHPKVKHCRGNINRADQLAGAHSRLAMDKKQPVFGRNLATGPDVLASARKKCTR